MLAKLTASQIVTHWERIKEAVKQSLPPTASISALGIRNIYEKLLNNSMQAWAYEVDGDIIGLMTTVVTNDTGTEDRLLMIYNFYMTKRLDSKHWDIMLETIREFASGQDCKRIMAYTNVGAVEERVKALGGRVDFKLVSIKV